MASRKKQLFKIIILGDSGVGKTSLMNRYVNHKYSPQYRATVGADFLAKDVNLEERLVTLQIWDTAGQERFQSLGGAFYRGADCCVLVYDITDQKSFESLESWREEFNVQGCPKDKDTFPFIIIGNKLDKQTERKVSEIKCQQWCKNNGNCQYFETSAKDDSNVEQCFKAIAKAAASNEVVDDLFFPTNVTIKKNTPSSPQSSGTQCNC